VRFGSWPLVFASYNAGYGAVLKSITAYNTNDFWELVRHESGLPWESSIYVPKILAAAIVGTNAAAFGFGEVALDPPYVYEEVEAPPGTSFAALARAAGARVETIEALNPHLLRGRTPPDRGPSRVRVPPGAASSFAANLETARAGEHTETIVLRFGETLDAVARARGLNVRELRRLKRRQGLGRAARGREHRRAEARGGREGAQDGRRGRRSGGSRRRRGGPRR
jgi:membrane-bound lytic murein transglycosylase D